MPNPMTTRPTPASTTRSALIATATATIPTPMSRPPALTAAAGPIRCTTGPDEGNPATEPADRHSSNNPSSAGPSPRESRAPGILEIQEASAIPQAKKTTASATRARSSVATVAAFAPALAGSARLSVTRTSTRG